MPDILQKVEEFPYQFEVPVGHYYQLYDSDNNLVSHTGVIYDHAIIRDVVGSEGGKPPYTIECYEEPRMLDQKNREMKTPRYQSRVAKCH